MEKMKDIMTNTIKSEMQNENIKIKSSQKRGIHHSKDDVAVMYNGHKQPAQTY